MPAFKLSSFVGFAATFCLASLAAPASAATSGDNGTHDPSRMLQSDGRFYFYGTGGGAKSSADGLVWKNEATSPPWNRSLSGNQGIWAPDGIYLNGLYYMYSSMWSSAKASAITLLTSPSLNPASPNYKWTDQGVVVAGPAGVTHSVIDPAPILDADGNLWITWGGGYPFGSGADSIFLTRLDNKTGLALTTDPGYKPPNSPGYALEQGHKEGSYMYYHNKYYYLFWQTGGCCSGTASTYTMHVARSQTITGPYSTDRVFYAATGNVHGPGHIGIYNACGDERFTYHFYPDNNSILGENELTWSSDGWPQVGAESPAMKPCATPGPYGSDESGVPAGGGASGGSSAGAGPVAGSGNTDTGGTGGGAVGGGDTGGAPTSGGQDNTSGSTNTAGTDSGFGGASTAGSPGTTSGAGAPTTAVAGSSAAGSEGNDQTSSCSVALPGHASGRSAWLLFAAIGTALAVSRRRK